MYKLPFRRFCHMLRDMPTYQLELTQRRRVSDLLAELTYRAILGDDDGYTVEGTRKEEKKSTYLQDIQCSTHISF